MANIQIKFISNEDKISVQTASDYQRGVMGEFSPEDPQPRFFIKGILPYHSKCEFVDDKLVHADDCNCGDQYIVNDFRELNDDYNF